MRTDTPQPVRLVDYRAPDFAIDATHLTFRLAPEATRVIARLTLRRLTPGAPLVLMGERLTPVSCAVDGQPVTPVITSETLTLSDVPDAFVLETEVEIAPAANTALEGLYMSSGRYCTQCEAEGFRKITWFLDRPDALSVYTVRIEAPKGFAHLLSNGNLIEQGDAEDGAYAVWHDPFPKPAYLFALVAGELDVLEDTYKTASNRTVALKIYVDPGMAARAEYAMDALKRSMRWDEEAYGREYDLDLFMIVAVRDFNFGAMENKGLNIFNSSLLLADPDTATDLDYERIESVIAHEYFHNWSGNRVTCRDWFQLCLKEGLTVFRDQSFSADMRGHAVQRIKDVKVLRARQFAEDSGPLAHPVRPDSYLKIDNFYTATIYEKGAEIVGMLKTVVGKDAYRKALDHYFATHDGTAARVEDFLESFAATCGLDIAPWFNWYTQAGTPVLEVESHHSGDTLTLTLSQSIRPTPGQPDKRPMPIPLRFGLLDETGTPITFSLNGKALTEAVEVLNEPVTALTLEGVKAPPVLSLLRGFSAPVILKYQEPLTHLLARLRGDPDPFARWEAAQALCRTLILRPEPDDASEAAYAEALALTLADEEHEPAFRALMLGVPTESELAQHMTTVDPAFVHARRSAFKAGLSARLLTRLDDAYEALFPDNLNNPIPFSPDVRQAGLRALRNGLLDLTMASWATGSEEVKARTAHLAQRHFQLSDNMTDFVAGLQALSHVSAEEFEGALEHFYDTERNEPLVIDKWFSLQATAARSDTFARVVRLTAHPDFDIKVPNRWRALVGGFSANQSVFHAVDGSGYDFLVEQILKVDAINPATAARMVDPLSRHARYAEPWRSAMRERLQRLLATKDLSRNTGELAAKALES